MPRSWPAKRHQQLILLRRGQQQLTWPCPMPLVLDAVGSALVVASGDPSDPVGRIPSHASNHLGGQPAGQEPEEVPAAALHWILRAPRALRGVTNTQRPFEA